ncbi:5-bromo-4-chloroindolyl phosphate hydrolysis family protein [Cardiobacteriaceae bacterium TAE3-ERU3]|nr:5-bromo-4-chloroindolyl phosphate hydrolysis family protein [Cardiobacteriaceae bacterium TAE3-ERU3]
MLKKFLDGLKIQHLSLRGSSLYLMQAPLWLAVPISLFRGQLLKSAALAMVIACITYGANLTRRYYLQKRDQILLGKADMPIRDERKIAMGFICLGVFILSVFATRRVMPVGLIATALAALGYYLNYLAEPYHAPDVDEHGDIVVEVKEEDEEIEEANLSPTLRSMLTNAREYLGRITQASTLLADSERDQYIYTRLKQILRRGNALIGELGKDGNRVREARTLLVVHLPELADISTTYSTANNAEKDQSRQQFSALLDTIHDQLTAHYRNISDMDQQRLSIQMDVLQEQLEQLRQDER